jgi:hypothetical protein
MDDEAQLSRPAQVSPFGSMHAELKTAIDQHTLEQFDRKAHAAGVTRSDVLRNLAYLFVHGKSFDKLMAEAADRRMRLLLGEGLELAQEIQGLQVRGETTR